MGIAPSQDEDSPPSVSFPQPRPSLGPRPHNAQNVPFATFRPASHFMRPVEYLRPVKIGRRVENVFVLHRRNIRLLPCDSNPSVYVLDFEFKADVPGTLAVYFKARERLHQTKVGDETVVTDIAYTPLGHLPSRHSFDRGDNQVYRQRAEDGLDLPRHSEADLKYSHGAVYPLVIRLDASNQSEQHSQNLASVKSHITLAQIVFDEGQPTVSVIEQKVFIGTSIFSMEDMYGIQASYNAGHSDQTDAQGDSMAECVVCLTEPSTTAVQPCKHLCLCDDCARILTLEVEAQQKCPVCRSSIGKLLRILNPSRENLETEGAGNDDGSIPGTGATTTSSVLPNWHPMQYTPLRSMQAPFATSIRDSAAPMSTTHTHRRNPLHTQEMGHAANLSEEATHPPGRLHLE
ncbi:unnamed protein product [Agarophyton chilense]